MWRAKSSLSLARSAVRCACRLFSFVAVCMLVTSVNHACPQRSTRHKIKMKLALSSFAYRFHPAPALTEELHPETLDMRPFALVSRFKFISRQCWRSGRRSGPKNGTLPMEPSHGNASPGAVDLINFHFPVTKEFGHGKNKNSTYGIIKFHISPENC